MSPESFLTPGMILAIVAMAFASVTVVIVYGVSVWAIRTAKTPAERKAQTEVAKRAVSLSPLKGLIRLPGSKEGDGG